MNFRLPPHPSRMSQTACDKTLYYFLFSVRFLSCLSSSDLHFMWALTTAVEQNLLTSVWQCVMKTTLQCGHSGFFPLHGWVTSALLPHSQVSSALEGSHPQWVKFSGRTVMSKKKFPIEGNTGRQLYFLQTPENLWGTNLSGSSSL